MAYRTVTKQYLSIIKLLAAIGIYLLLIIFGGNTFSVKNYVTEEHTVTKIIDGDTIEIETGQQVRYIGMDTPEFGQYLADVATKRNETLVANKKVALEYDISKVDKYDRLLAYVWVDGTLLNNQLVKEGLAKPLTIAPDTKYKRLFKQSALQAKINRKGVWNKI